MIDLYTENLLTLSVRTLSEIPAAHTEMVLDQVRGEFYWRVMPMFRVELVAPKGDVLREQSVSAFSADEAVAQATGERDLQRGGKLRAGVVLRAKVYLEAGGMRTLTRFYGLPLDEACEAKARLSVELPR
jgi:hypothetical protein